ncbi:methyltransferase domain-containing protein [Clostridium sp. YIM B02551]|uniref:methyltransferase domain-containing protein n=1 Tax=Clostridium sp. YIM B02551 TaxID=2910679 RepID=UPI001EECE851|nr:methyltransferase domain-containing protein [Clostridium sp. YIM B02551]
MGDWNSNQYLMFKNERTQPAIDLANRIIIDNPKKIIDIGCGPGNSTKVLKERFPDSYILGIDSSTNMIEAAKKDYPEIDFKICDASKGLSNLGDDFDIVFSNACIQWIPNHNELLRSLFGLLKKGGVLAVQTPMNYKEPIHNIIEEVSANKKWKDEFENHRIFYNLMQGEYFDLLSEISSEFSLWETIYFHNLKSHKEIIKWYRATGLRPYLDELSGDKKEAFEKDIYDRVVEEYPSQRNGNVIFRFPRFFFIARK